MEIPTSSNYSQEKMRHISYPVCWGDVIVDPRNASDNFIFSEEQVSEQLQLEYWWKSNNSENILISTSDSGQKRAHLTEYQLVREVIWSLLGSNRSNVFSHVRSGNELFLKVVPSEFVSLSHLSHPATDSILGIFGRWCNHNSVLRKFVDRVSVSVDYTRSPCLHSFVLTVSDLLSSFDRLLHDLEKDSRSPCCFTLLSLHDRLLPWSRRIGVIAGIIMQTTSGKPLTDEACAVQLMDNLFYLMDSFRCCILDNFFINYLENLFVRTLQPFLLSVIELLSGSCSLSDPLIDHFADVDRTIKPDNPLFWFCGIKVKTPNSSVSSNTLTVPRIFVPVLTELVCAIKAVFLIMSITEKSNCSLEAKIVVDPLVVLQDIHKSTKMFALTNSTEVSSDCHETKNSGECIHSYHFTIDSNGTRSNDSYTFPAVELGIRHFIYERSKIINQELLKLLLGPTSPSSNNFRNLGVCLATIGAVYLFGAGDRMNDFARELFQNTGYSSLPIADHVGLTLTLRNHFDVSIVSSRASITHKSFLPEIEYFSFMKRPTRQELTTDSSFQTSVIQYLKSLNLDYTTEWPLTIILDAAAIETYDSAFSFLLQIKYVKWILEYLRFDSLGNNIRQNLSISHELFLLRNRMLFIFNSLHDFLAHRIEGMRVQFIKRWQLPDVVSQTNSSRTDNFIIQNETLTDLINDHNNLLKHLRSTCLQNESSILLRQEVDSLCDMVWTLKSFWLGRYHIGSQQIVQTEFKALSNRFDNHIGFLATMLSRAVHLTNSKQLLPLSDAFAIAAAYI